MTTENFLVEFCNVSQHSGSFRRLFTNNHADLWLWYTEDKTTLTGFQITWDEAYAITWTVKEGLSFNRITEDRGYNPALLLNGSAGRVDPSIIPWLMYYAKNLDQDLRKFIIKQIIKGAHITQHEFDVLFKQRLDR